MPNDSLDKLRAAMEAASTAPKGDSLKNENENYWKPELDKSGNGYAVIRFLPTPEGEEMPWVSYFDHGFQGPGGWYIEKSLTTIGKKDPVSEYNTQLWNTGIEANKEIARKQKRRLHYVSNIYVVSDPKNPQNEGKVFMYRYGKKIFEMLKEAISPAFEDENPINPFDLRGEGANFKIKIRKVDGYWNYDKSEFDSLSPLTNDEDELNTWCEHLESSHIYSVSPGLLFIQTSSQLHEENMLRKTPNKLRQHSTLTLSCEVVPKTTTGSIWTPYNKYAVEFTQTEWSKRFRS